jgi:hypothetical protein
MSMRNTSTGQLCSYTATVNTRVVGGVLGELRSAALDQSELIGRATWQLVPLK